MLNLFKKTTLATAMAATALASATPALARDGYRHHDDTGTAIAVGAGLLGLVAIAAIASSKDHDRCDGDGNDPRWCYDRGAYRNGSYNGGVTYRDGYYRDGYVRDGRYYYRHDYGHHDYDYDRGGYRGW